MAVSDVLNPVTTYLKGEYGFLTVLLAILVVVYFVMRRKNKAKMKKRLEEKPVGYQPPRAPKPEVPAHFPYAPPAPEKKKAEDDPFFNLDMASLDGRSLYNVERDAISILTKKTEDVEVSLIQGKREIHKRLEELEETEKSIKEIVDQLKIKYRQVLRQKKTYQLMKRSLEITQEEEARVR